ncbi:MAG TPA: aldo/keto reductase [Phycisphaerae bacterium]|nr:aldo/keto reductase [Phycisphaerae bacterium]HSA29163.1 aldo/keto reductase [Phycisphaerae bacterium]
MDSRQVSRREFVQGAAATAAGMAVGAALAASAGRAEAAPATAPAPDPRKTRSYNENMEYRCLGRTGLMLSAVSMGGHWKCIPFSHGSEDFKKNRREVISAALDHGINYVDACSSGEVMVYAEALGRRREQIYFGFDWHGGRDPQITGSLEKMKQQLDEGLQAAKLEYVDVWRVTLREQVTRNTEQEIEAVAAALEWGKKTGKARATGLSTHHRAWIAEAVSKYPSFEVIITPYAAGSKEKPAGSMFDAIRKHNVGLIGIKPFASGTLFGSGGTPDSPTKEEDDERARMAIRYVLCCDVLTATIPGLITVDQVKNVAAAVQERRRFDRAEAARYEALTDRMWADLPANYQWLRQWEWV